MPDDVRDQTRLAVRQAATSPPVADRWIPGTVAALLAVAIVSGFLGASALRRDQAPATPIVPPSPCAASSLVVTGTRGERLHPDELPPGFVLEHGSEYELGGVGSLMYSTPGYGDRPYLELSRYVTTLPAASLIAGGPLQTITVQGKPGVVSGSAANGFINVAIEWSSGIVVVVTGYSIPEAEVLAVSDHLQYVAGTEFTYPAQPKVAVTRQRALSALSSSSSSARAVLTSFGEVDAVIQTSGAINRVPTLDPSVEVIRPVWVVWSPADENTTLTVQKGAVIDANSGVKLANLTGVHTASLLSLTDRSQSACEPPFGVLTRSEIQSLIPAMPGTTGTVKVMTLQMLRSIQEGSTIGDCSLAACDPGVPVWVWVGSAGDCRLLFRCFPPPNPNVSPLPAPPPGSWALKPFDARTGPQNTELSGRAGGHGPLPSEVADLPDLAPAP